MSDFPEKKGYPKLDKENADWAGFTSTTTPKLESSQNVGRAFGIWIHPFTRLHKIPVFRKIWLYLVAVVIYSLIVNIFVDDDFSTKILKEVGNAAYLGVIFGLLLVFRTNSAYERWWEGRRLWGVLVNESRNLALKLKAYSDAPVKEKIRMGEQIVSFSYALKHHLRDTRPTRDLPGLEPIAQIPVNIHLPAHVSGKIVATLQRWSQEGYLSEFKLMLLDQHFNVFMDVCGACERIKSTPLAVSYRAFLRQGILMNILILPWAIIPIFGDWMGIPIILIASYFLIGLELIAESIEEPFGVDGDDLPLDTICNNIQKTVAEILSVNDNTKKFTTSYNMPSVDPLRYTTSVKRDNIDPLKDMGD